MALEHSPIRHSSHKLVSPRTPQQVPLFSRKVVAAAADHRVSESMANDGALRGLHCGNQEVAELAAAARRFEQADRERAEFKHKWEESQLQLLRSENEIAQLQLKLQQQHDQQSPSRADSPLGKQCAKQLQQQPHHLFRPQQLQQDLLQRPSSPSSSTPQPQMLQRPPSPGTPGSLGPPLAMRRGQSGSRLVTSNQRSQDSGADSIGNLHPRTGSRASPRAACGPSPTGSSQSMAGIAALASGSPRSSLGRSTRVVAPDMLVGSGSTGSTTRQGFASVGQQPS